MKKYRNIPLLFLGVLALAVMNAGCVSTTLHLASNHPARIDAPSGQADPEPAAILRPGAPLYPSEEGLAAPAASENHEHEQAAAPDAEDRTPNGTREAPYVGQGVIQSIGEGQLEIRHGSIPGFMGAMTMIFPVAPEAMRDSLEVGTEILFKIEALPEQRYRIFRIEILPEEGHRIFDFEALAAGSDETWADETGSEHDGNPAMGSARGRRPFQRSNPKVRGCEE